MKVLSLVIGIANYNDQNHILRNPVNDARDLSEKFKLLGYTVTCLTDVTSHQIHEALYNFSLELGEYDVGIFYFAGHGMQIKGQNFLALSDTDLRNEINAKHTSMPLNNILDTMHECSNNTNIIILDACRDNPFENSWNRSIVTTGLAPVHAPKGTLIAYATSPGEKAKDGIGNNGLYTSMFLKNLESVNLSAEEFFKRVRNSVYSFSDGEQTSWEHTSLTGTFYFNSGVHFHSGIHKKYSDQAIKDAEFRLSDSDISKIIEKLKIHNWYTQNPAIHELQDLKYQQEHDKNELFVLGRNFLQTANGGEYLATEMITSISKWIYNFNTAENENYFLDGLLYEIYFDHRGIFRDENFKDGLMNHLNPLQHLDILEKSFRFIETELVPFKNRSFYLLKFKNKPILLDLIFKKNVEGNDDVYILNDVNHESISVMKTESNRQVLYENEECYQPFLNDDLKTMISRLSKIPILYIMLSNNYEHEMTRSSKIKVPDRKIISKR